MPRSLTYTRIAVRSNRCLLLLYLILLVGCTWKGDPRITSVPAPADVGPTGPQMAQSSPSSTLISRPTPDILYALGNGSGEIWKIDPENGGQSLLMTVNDQIVYGLTLSPDRAKFAFSTDLDGAWLVSADGKDSTQITTEWIWLLRWIGHERLHYCDINSSLSSSSQVHGDCYLYDVHTGQTIKALPITTTVPTNFEYEIAPDYSHIAFTRENDSHYYVLDTASRETRSVFQTSVLPPAGKITGRWSPDGKQLALGVSQCCTQASTSDSKLYVVKADGTALREIVDLNAIYPALNIGILKGLAWSPDGQWLSFVISLDARNSSSGTIHIVNMRQGSVRNLGVSVAGQPWPIWSPDGQQLLFSRAATVSDYDLWTVDIETGGETQITFDGIYKLIYDW